MAPCRAVVVLGSRIGQRDILLRRLPSLEPIRSSLEQQADLKLPEFGGGHFKQRSEFGHCGHRRPDEQPLVPPHVSHFRQVPLRTSVKFPHSRQASPSYPPMRGSARRSASRPLTSPR